MIAPTAVHVVTSPNVDGEMHVPEVLVATAKNLCSDVPFDSWFAHDYLRGLVEVVVASYLPAGGNYNDWAHAFAEIICAPTRQPRT